MKKPKKEEIKKWWNADHYLAGEIVECVSNLLRYQHGYPSSLMAKGKPESKCVKEWDDILTEIRDGFKWYYENDGDFYMWKGAPATSVKWARSKKPKRRLVKDRAHMQQFRKAKMLLVIYYEHLWD